MPEVVFERTVEQMGRLKLRGASLRVGYRAPYAVYVHENLTARHAVGRAKFLEEPMRTMAPELTAIIAGRLRAMHSVESALSTAGERLMEASQALVPVATGRLKSSAFVEVDRAG